MIAKIWIPKRRVYSLYYEIFIFVDFKLKTGVFNEFLRLKHYDKQVLFNSAAYFTPF